MSLTQSILESHTLASRAPRPGVPIASPLEVRPDLLLSDRDSARFAFGRFAALRLARPAIPCVIASDALGVPAAVALDPPVVALDRMLREAGAVVVPPRAGDRATLALDSFAAPGRLVATLGPSPEGGALGALMLPVGELETLALLRGEPLEFDLADVRRVELTGELPPRCEGLDLAGALIAAQADHFAGRVVEFGGEGVAALEIPDRVAVCRALVAAGARAVIFPCDDRARDYLRERGREADWRRTDSGDPGDGARGCALEWTVPHAISCRRPHRVVPVAWWNEVAVGAVDVGPGLSPASLARFAALLRDRPVPETVALRVGLGSARDADAFETDALREAVTRLGGRWRAESDLGPATRRSGRLRLRCGGTYPASLADDEDWMVSAVTAAEAACRGRLDPPHHWPDPREVTPIEITSRPRAPLPMPRETGEPVARPRIPAPGEMRGPVLGRLEGHLDGASLLPLGPTVIESLADPSRLAEHVVPWIRREAGLMKSGGAGGWLLVTGEVRGLAGREAGLLALDAVGVRGVLAGRFEPGAAALCARAGLLALRALHPNELVSIHAGDELELVSGFESFPADRARVVRDLTRGLALIALPEFGPREWNWVRSARAMRES